MRRLPFILAAIGLAAALPSLAAPDLVVRNSVAVCDPYTPSSCIRPSSAGGVVTGGTTVIASGTFTRPSDTTAYAVGDLVANSTTAGSVVPISLTVARANDTTGMIRRCALATSSTSTTNASFRAHLYNVSPTPANGDNGAYSTSGVAGYLGALDITLGQAFTDGAKGIGTPNTGSEVNFVPASGTRVVYALIEARAAYTPTSAGTFTLSCETLQN